MRIARFKYTTTLICGVFFVTLAGCTQHGHKKEEKLIQQERLQKEKATADLSEAVAATDEAAWDAASLYKQFCDTLQPKLSSNTKLLDNFKEKVSHGRKKIPLRYRGRIRKLEQRNEDLKYKLDHHRINHKADWEDFTTLYLYDLQRLEKDIRKLTAQ